MPGKVRGRADIMQWWSYVPGADWRHPTGPGSSIEGKETHPVVQVSPEDAAAYAAWAGGRLPSEQELGSNHIGFRIVKDIDAPG
ncbi:SUMF1/EgtB/PvdO family nonheme iron enzyme [Pelagibius marinus]|uniref:SUMF1/EgtB/PvdO family nonheme iron enzyme n=1 Tax=Pelagibius marinus TaxID=2762760 RepID=UPI0029CAAA13|nr:SUMF1/EgtB/PvdO family nonheme iron enzyme [Pelagibius marinus]